MFEQLGSALSQFHFLQPAWLLALIPLALIYWLVVHKKTAHSDWDKVIDAHLLQVLLAKSETKKAKSLSALLMLAWLIAVLALANPVWEKKAIPVFQTNTARVIVLDLSRSMNIADIKPSRLERAKFKIKDILARQEEGQTGLVVFAGDAFIVTPLTRDADTINSLLAALKTEIMPVQGSRVDLGLLKAKELLQQAGVAKGQVLLIADGARKATSLLAVEALRDNGHRVSVLGVGTQQGGPIPNVRGRDSKPIIVPLQKKLLQQIAEQGGGQYRDLSTSSADIDHLLASLSTASSQGANKVEGIDNSSNDWQAQGPLLVLLLLPLAAIAFRKGWLLTVGLIVITLGQPQPVMASVWDSLWKRQDQLADQALQAGDYEQAEVLAEDPLRRGSAAFKKGDYEKALSDFSEAQGVDAAYNKGNALAKLKKYEDAIKAYDEALKQQPDMQDATNNRAMVQALLDKKKEQEKQQQQSKSEDKNKNKEQDKKKDQNKDQQQDQNQQDSKENSQQGGDKKDQEQQEQGKQGQEKQDQQNKEGNNKEGEEGKKESEQSSEENQFAKANEEKDKEREKKGEEKEAEKAKQLEELAKQADENQNKKAEEGGDKDKTASVEQVGKKEGEQSKDNDKEAKEDEAKVIAEQQQGDKKDAEASQEQEKAEHQAMAEALSKEEKIAAEQWLRRIEDDPGELLKRKFRYQYKRRRQSAGSGDSQPW